MGSENQAQRVLDRYRNEQIALAVLDHAQQRNKGLTRVERDKLLFLLKHLRAHDFDFDGARTEQRAD